MQLSLWIAGRWLIERNSRFTAHHFERRPASRMRNNEPKMLFDHLRRGCAGEMPTPRSKNALAEFSDCSLGKGQPEARLLVQRHPSVGDLGRVFEQLRLEWIALGVSERLHDAPGGTGGHDCAGHEAGRMRRNLDVVQLAQPGELAPFGKASHHRAVELQDANRLLLEYRPAAVARKLAFAGR